MVFVGNHALTIAEKIFLQLDTRNRFHNTVKTNSLRMRHVNGFTYLVTLTMERDEYAE